MFDPPSGGGQTLLSGVFSGMGGQIRLIPFAMSQKSLAASLDTPQRVSGKNFWSKEIFFSQTKKTRPPQKKTSPQKKLVKICIEVLAGSRDFELNEPKKKIFFLGGDIFFVDQKIFPDNLCGVSKLAARDF